MSVMNRHKRWEDKREQKTANAVDSAPSDCTTDSYRCIEGAQMRDAQVVYERDDGFDIKTGPFGYERVGFRIGARIWWVACTDSVSINKDFAEQVKLANDIVSRWNAPAQSVSKEG